ncbi:TlpA disulfide reductase family protein [Chryseobacterium sp. GM_Chr_2]|uniref:TlpA family protein disulfide reductase n=1 Tax=unclassified Chryseobacterium TaxID=2593645 RepID=UPI00320ADC2F
MKLSEIIKKNKYTMLDFWASWCMPCRAEFPNQRKAYEQYHQKGFEIYAVSLDDTMKSWLKALEKENTPWYNLVDVKGMKGNSTNSYGVNSIPATFLITQNGTIIASGDELRGNGLRKILKNLFK